ncbi:MAG: hypothetical protein IBJ18_10675 [Phycisphaerales bacterium]|nr:hypothetical protein [Phycisphaerales bacterium]
MMNDVDSVRHVNARRPMVLAAWAFAMAWLVLAGLILLSDSSGSAFNVGRAKFDQDVFHLKVITKFAQELPTPGLRDYLSATTPGYHLVLAAVKRLFGAPELALRLFAALCTAGLVGVLVWVSAKAANHHQQRSAGWWWALTPALPVLCSSYVVQSGMYLLPDNAAWLMVALVMLLSLNLARTASVDEVCRPRRLDRWIVPSALLLMALVFTRQIHIWAAAVVWVGALVACAKLDQTPPWSASSVARTIEHARALLRALTNRAVICAVLATAPAFAIVGGFVFLWGGLTPPTFRASTNPGAISGAVDATTVTGTSPATAVLVLALVGLFGLFFAGYWLASSLSQSPGTKDRNEALIATIKAGGLGGFIAGVLSAIPTTTWLSPSRKGALWEITRKFEGDSTLAGIRLPRLVVADHVNLVMWLLAVVGGVVLGICWRAADARARWVLAAGLIAFTAANCAQALSWQRYLEPMVLLWWVLMIASLRWDAPARLWRWAWVGPVLLAGLLATVTFGQFGT